MRMPGYPEAVPSQYAVHYHPWPTRFHGPLYQRPEFRFPWQPTPQNVLMPWQREGFDGLGNVAGSGGQYDVGDGIFKPGGWGGGIFDSNLSGLGADETYPWHAYSDTTKKFQETVNDALRAQGYCPIDADGKLGAATCGASKALIGQYPPTCQSFTPPSKGPCAGGATAPAAIAPAPLPATTPSTAPAAYHMSMWSSGSWKKYAAFGLGALAVGGVAYYLTRKKGS